MSHFMGYVRPDGKVGVRNKVLILPTSICASDVCRIVSSEVAGTTYFENQAGCAQGPLDMQITLDTLVGWAANPNVYATLVISLGCDDITIENLMDSIRKRTNKPLEGLVIQQCGGTVKTIEKAIGIAQKLVAEAQNVHRTEVPLSELFFASECGGSDPTSGLAANPVVGNVSDRLVAAGATSMFSETGEIIGGEHILAKRMNNPELEKLMYHYTWYYNEQFRIVGEPNFMDNLSEGNIRAGLSTTEEKSLGCIFKGGYSPIREILPYAKAPTKKGLIFMDTPGYDAASIAGMVAGGATVVAFTSGLGSPVGCPIAPVIKMTGNYLTFQSMNDNMDFDASPVITSGKSIDEVGKDLFDLLLDVCNGKQTKSEQYNFLSVSTARLCNFN